MTTDATRAPTATDRLQRLLALVPYVVSRKAVGMAETAAAFGVTERQLVDDLNMLWCVELRSPDPYCPIDLSYEGGEIVISEAERPGRRACRRRCGPGRAGPGSRRAGRRPAAAPVLLRAGPGRGHRARCRPDAPGHGGRPPLPGGLVPPRRGGPDLPAGPDPGHRGAGHPRAGAVPGPAGRRRPGPVPAVP